VSSEGYRPGKKASGWFLLRILWDWESTVWITWKLGAWHWERFTPARCIFIISSWGFINCTSQSWKRINISKCLARVNNLTWTKQYADTFAKTGVDGLRRGLLGGRGTRGVLRSPGRWQTMKCGQETLSAKSALSIYMYMYVGIFCLHIYAWPIDDVWIIESGSRLNFRWVWGLQGVKGGSPAKRKHELFPS